MLKLKITLLNTATFTLETNQEGQKISDLNILKEIKKAYREGKLEEHVLTPKYFDEIDSDWEIIDEVYMEIDNEVYMFGLKDITLYDEKGIVLDQVEYK